MVIANRGQNLQGALEVPLLEQVKRLVLQLQDPTIELALVAGLGCWGIHQLPLQPQGLGPLALAPEFSRFEAPALPLLLRRAVAQPAQGLELLAVTQAGVEVSGGSRLFEPLGQLPFPPIGRANT